MSKITSQELSYRQNLPLEDKLKITHVRIQEWYEYYNGQVYIAFSGGKDSTVLLHIVRSLYPEIPAVFCNTGLEFPEIISFIKNINNVVWLKPKYSFKQILERWGYPVISKRTAMTLNRYLNTSDSDQKELRLTGKCRNMQTSVGKIPDKWAYLINAPFKISDYCCNVMKKNPFKSYNKKTGKYGYIGLMASDSNARKINYQQWGCNAFEMKYPQSRPLSFWGEGDVWKYIKTHNLSYSSIYDMGYTRTGCIFCAFGCHMEERKHGTNRFKIMKRTHPKLWSYCMNQLNMREVLEYCGLQVEEKHQQLFLPNFF